MSTQPERSSALFFLDGAAVDAGGVRIFLAAGFRDLDSHEGRALLAFDNDEWSSFDLPDEIISTAVHGPDGSFLALTKNGIVAIARQDGISTERIPDAGVDVGQYGYVKQIRSIGGEIFVCGDLRQVYRRDRGRWTHLDGNILNPDRLAIGSALNSIDGTNVTNIYAAGDRGRIYHHGGGGWADVESPTNVDLERVVCASDDEILIAGNHGTLLRGNARVLDVIRDPGVTDRFWGLAIFRETAFVCSSRTIYALVGGALDPVPIDIPFEGSLHRLTSSHSYLWAVGTNSLLRFDGSTWGELRYPFNT